RFGSASVAHWHYLLGDPTRAGMHGRLLSPTAAGYSGPKQSGSASSAEHYVGSGAEGAAKGGGTSVGGCHGDETLSGAAVCLFCTATAVDCGGGWPCGTLSDQCLHRLGRRPSPILQIRDRSAPPSRSVSVALAQRLVCSLLVQAI